MVGPNGGASSKTQNITKVLNIMKRDYMKMYTVYRQSGYIVDSNNIHELEQKIVSFFNSYDLDEMPKYIESNKEKFSWEYHIEGILELADES